VDGNYVYALNNSVLIELRFALNPDWAFSRKFGMKQIYWVLSHVTVLNVSTSQLKCAAIRFLIERDKCADKF